jgi:hypothetical protein
MFQGGMWIFAAPDPAVVGIDSTTDMKRALTTENYEVQKFPILFQSYKALFETPCIIL